MRSSALAPSTKLVAVLTGLVVPALFFGRAVMAVPLLVVIPIVSLWLPGRGDYWRQLIRVARTPVGFLFLITLALWVPNIFFSPVPLRSFEAWARIPIFVGSVTLLWAMLSTDGEALYLTFKVLLIASIVTTALAFCSLTFMPEILTFFRTGNWLPVPYHGFRPPDILKAYAGAAILLVPALVLAGRRLGGR